MHESEEPSDIQEKVEPNGLPESEEPGEELETDELNGIKGWLLLVGASVALSPIIMLREMYEMYGPVFEDGTWAAYTDPASVDYTPYYASSVVAEMFVDVVFFFVSLWLAYLFFTRSPLFPKVFIGLLLASPCMLIFCYWLRTWPFPNQPMLIEGDIVGLIISCLRAVIWIPYMRLSKRVRHTFVAEPSVEENVEA